jgi:hypothetical protein
MQRPTADRGDESANGRSLPALFLSRDGVISNTGKLTTTQQLSMRSHDVRATSINHIDAISIRVPRILDFRRARPYMSRSVLLRSRSP